MWQEQNCRLRKSCQATARCDMAVTAYNEAKYLVEHGKSIRSSVGKVLIFQFNPGFATEASVSAVPQ